MLLCFLPNMTFQSTEWVIGQPVFYCSLLGTFRRPPPPPSGPPLPLTCSGKALGGRTQVTKRSTQAHPGKHMHQCSARGGGGATRRCLLTSSALAMGPVPLRWAETAHSPLPCNNAPPRPCPIPNGVWHSEPEADPNGVLRCVRIPLRRAGPSQRGGEGGALSCSLGHTTSGCRLVLSHASTREAGHGYAVVLFA